MDIREAYDIYNDFLRQNSNFDKDDFFLFTEATKFLIDETADPVIIFTLDGVYYENQLFNLTLKYYEMAASKEYEPAFMGLGYIWYYGRTGIVDYQKAFEYFSKVGYDERNYIIAQYKIADMYKNGYYLERNFDNFKDIIEKLYPLVKYTNNVQDPLPEVCVRLAQVREKDGDIAAAISLLREAKSMLSSRIGFDPFFGNFSIMRGIIDDLYRMTEFNREKFDIYDLYYLTKEPVKVRFTYNGIEHIIESVREQDGSVSVCFDGKWFRTFDDVLKNVKLNGYHMTLSTWKMKNFRIIG